MSIDPHAVLGLPADADDDAVRRRYLELIKEFPPARAPEKFNEIRAAYDALRDLTTRVRTRLFASKEAEQLDPILEELSCPTAPRPRLTLEQLQAIAKRT